MTMMMTRRRITTTTPPAYSKVLSAAGAGVGVTAGEGTAGEGTAGDGAGGDGAGGDGAGGDGAGTAGVGAGVGAAVTFVTFESLSPLVTNSKLRSAEQTAAATKHTSVRRNIAEEQRKLLLSI